MPTETTPLLSRHQLPPPISWFIETHPRIHYLDNLRAFLTAVLIIQHSIKETVQQNIHSPAYASKWQSLPLSLTYETTETFLWAIFFFVSGYSSQLSVASKPSDWKFLLKRITTIGLPALLYNQVFQRQLFHYLGRWKEIFGDASLAGSYTRLEGPVKYVQSLLALDLIYFCLRALNRQSTFSSAWKRVDPSHRFRRHLIAWSLLITLTTTTFFNSTHPFFPPNLWWSFISYDEVGPYAPLQFIMAYTTGIHFGTLRTTMLAPYSRSVIALCYSSAVTFLSMGAAQHFWPSLWEYIQLRGTSHGRPSVIEGGYSLPAAFYAIWSTWTCYTISTSLVACFAGASWAKASWGPVARHTFPQTFIHMVPLLLALYYLSEVDNLIVYTALVSLFAVLGSWMMVLGAWGVCAVFVRGVEYFL